MRSKYCLIYITAPNKKEAEKLAQFLIKEKLVACVNIFPVESFFWWEKKVQKEKEWAMVVKTKTNLVNEVIKKIKNLHPYEIPCIISLPIEKGYQKFLQWIKEVTK